VPTRRSVPYSALAMMVSSIRYQQADEIPSVLFFTDFRCCVAEGLVALDEQELAAIADRDLRHLGKTLQQPRQHHFQSHVIVSDVDVT